MITQRESVGQGRAAVWHLSYVDAVGELLELLKKNELKSIKKCISIVKCSVIDADIP